MSEGSLITGFHRLSSPICHRVSKRASSTKRSSRANIFCRRLRCNFDDLPQVIGWKKSSGWRIFEEDFWMPSSLPEASPEPRTVQTKQSCSMKLVRQKLKGVRWYFFRINVEKRRKASKNVEKRWKASKNVKKYRLSAMTRHKWWHKPVFADIVLVRMLRW